MRIDDPRDQRQTGCIDRAMGAAFETANRCNAVINNCDVSFESFQPASINDVGACDQQVKSHLRKGVADASGEGVGDGAAIGNGSGFESIMPRPSFTR